MPIVKGPYPPPGKGDDSRREAYRTSICYSASAQSAEGRLEGISSGRRRSNAGSQGRGGAMGRMKGQGVRMRELDMTVVRGGDRVMALDEEGLGVRRAIFE